MSQEWNEIIGAKSNWYDLKLKSALAYKDLILLFVRRDLIAQYKQSILGPAWIIITPLVTTLVFTLVFGQVGELGTNGIPQFLFYMSGIICWKYFDECIKKTSNIFVSNANIFGKVYFPRLTVPFSIIITGSVMFFIQLFIFIGIYVWKVSSGEVSIDNLNLNNLLFIPLVLLNVAAIGMGLGLIVCSLTTKYRDFRFLVEFGLQLLMYLSPVIMPLSVWKEKNALLGKVVEYNPMTNVIEIFRSLFFEGVTVEIHQVITSVGLGLITLLIGIMIFNKVERTFMDTV